MVLHGIEKIMNNTDVMIHIFKMLHFSDQLRLARVNATLRNIFENYIWKERYGTLIIYYGSDIVVNNESGLNRIAIFLRDFKDFLDYYVDQIEEMRIENLYAEHSGVTKLTYERQRTTENPAHICQPENLTGLGFYDVDIPIEQIALVPQNCQTFYQTAEEIIEHDIMKMSRLKRLSIKNHIFHIRGFYTDFMNDMKEYIQNHVQAKRDSSSTKSKHLKEMIISVSCYDYYEWHYKRDVFENLVILTIRSSDDTLTDKMMTIISTTCRNLEKLHIENSNWFQDPTTLPPKLTELSIKNCRFIDQGIVKHILTKSTLKRFTCLCEERLADFEDFQISPLIQVLDIKCVNMTIFKSAYQENENLQELTWYADAWYNDPSHVTNVPLATCVNLETLSMVECLIDIGILLQLQHLKKVIMRRAPPLQWCYITALLKHPPLNELIIETFQDRNYDPDIPIDDFETNVKIVNVETKVFMWSIDFWLELFRHNKGMKLMLSHPYGPPSSSELRMIINHEKFPRSLQTIHVCGFSINCNKLRNNFDSIMRTLEFTLRYNLPYSEEENMYIILCRNK